MHTQAQQEPEQPPARPDDAPVQSARQDAIEKRAYEVYQNRRAEDGDALSDWLQAECELRAETSR